MSDKGEQGCSGFNMRRSKEETIDSMSIVMEELKKINEKMNRKRCSLDRTFKNKIAAIGCSFEKQLNDKLTFKGWFYDKTCEMGAR